MPDYHPDLGMECSGYYSPQSGLIGTRWRGVRFENARHKKELTQGNTLYVKVNNIGNSKSVFFFIF